MTEVTRIDAKAEAEGDARVLASNSLSLLLKTARIAAEVEIFVAFLGVSFVVVVEGVRVAVEMVGEVVAVEVVVGVVEVLLEVAAVSVLAVGFEAWCSCQCARAKACLCLSVQGFFCLRFGLHLGAFLTLFEAGRRNASWASRFLYFAAAFAAAVVGLSVTVRLSLLL